MTIAIILIALFSKYPKGIPMASTCSAAISAACHRPKEDKEAHFFPVEWGVVGYNENGVGHCSFTTDKNVTRPRKGELYA